MKSVSKFKINQSWKSRDHGLVIVGENIDGDISAGHWITFLYEQQEITLEVKAVENNITISGKHITGLIFKYKSSEEQKILEGMRLNQQIATIWEL